MWQATFLGTKKVKSAMLDIISHGGHTEAACEAASLEKAKRKGHG